jgi:predicted Zn-dependent peptidase
VLHVRLVVPGGAALETIHAAGTSALTARSLAEGTLGRSADALAVALERHGSAFEAFAQWDALELAATTPGIALRPVMELLTEVFAEPAFRDEDIERVRRRLFDELTMLRFQPPYRAGTAFAGVAFTAGSRMTVPRAGVADSIAALRLDAVRQYWSSVAMPGQATVIIAGDLTGIAAEDVLLASVGTWSSVGDAPVVAGAASGVSARRALTVVDFPEAVQTSLVLGAVTPRVAPDNRAAMAAGVHYLGGFLGSRLNSRIREQLAASYGATAQLEHLADASILRMQAAVETGSTATAAEIMEDEVAALMAGDVDAPTMHEAIDNLARASVMRYAHPAAVVGALERMVVEGLPADHYQQVHDDLLDLTSDDVVEAFRAHVGRSAICGAAAGAAAKVKEPLSGLGYTLAVEPRV